MQRRIVMSHKGEMVSYFESKLFPEELKANHERKKRARTISRFYSERLEKMVSTLSRLF